MSTAVAVVDINSLELVGEINAEHRACRANYSIGLQHAIACGEKLHEVRRLAPHGTWGAWVGEHFDGSLRTAEKYIELANVSRQEPELIEETEGGIEAAISYIGRQAGGQRDLSLEHGEHEAPDKPAPTYSLTLAQLTSLACKRWHRPPSEKDVLGWLKDANLA